MEVRGLIRLGSGANDWLIVVAELFLRHEPGMRGLLYNTKMLKFSG